MPVCFTLTTIQVCLNPLTFPLNSPQKIRSEKSFSPVNLIGERFTNDITYLCKVLTHRVPLFTIVQFSVICWKLFRASMSRSVKFMSTWTLQVVPNTAISLRVKACSVLRPFIVITKCWEPARMEIYTPLGHILFTSPFYSSSLV